MSPQPMILWTYGCSPTKKHSQFSLLQMKLQMRMILPQMTNETYLQNMRMMLMVMKVTQMMMMVQVKVVMKMAQTQRLKKTPPSLRMHSLKHVTPPVTH